MFMSQSVLNPTDTDVLMFNTGLNENESLSCADFQIWKKALLCTSSCTASLASSTSCPSVALPAVSRRPEPDIPIVKQASSFPKCSSVKAN